MLYRRKDIPAKEHDAIHEDEKLFYEGFRSPAGPLKWMTHEDKERIHLQIDLKMDQLEQTGLSREEVLFDKPGGLRLSEDPVFQYIRANREAREMLVKPGEEFTAKKVVDYALRQDIGVDRSRAALLRNTLYEHELPDGYDVDVASGKIYPDKIKPEDYYFKEKLASKESEYNKIFKSSGQMFPKVVLSRNKTRKKNLRNISLNDVDPKNTEFLAQFMTPAGLIKNRWQTRLKARAQRKISRAIKHARNLNLFPFTGYILPPHKINLAPLHTQNYNTTVIHAETGTVFSKKYEAEITRLNELEFPNTIEKTALKFKFGQTEDDISQNMKKLEDLIDLDIQFIPSKKQVEMLEAQNYLKNKQGEGKEMFEKIEQKVKNIRSEEIARVFIREKAASEELLKDKQESEASSSASVMALWDDLSQLKRQLGIEVKEPKWILELASPSK